MLLTPAQHRDLARRAQWYFDCYFGPPGDYVTFTGDGIEDLDRLIERLNTNAQYNRTRNQRFLCDVGGQYSDWRNFDIEDVYAIREQYLLYWGDVNKPNVYVAGSNVALPVDISNQYRGSSPQVSIE